MPRGAGRPAGPLLTLRFAKNDEILLELVALVLMVFGFEAAVQLSPKPASILNQGCSDRRAEQDLKSSSPGPAPESEDVPSLPLTPPFGWLSELTSFPVRVVRPALPFPPFPAAGASLAGGVLPGSGPPLPRVSSELAGLGVKKSIWVHRRVLGHVLPRGHPWVLARQFVVGGQGLVETPGEARGSGGFGSSLK